MIGHYNTMCAQAVHRLWPVQEAKQRAMAVLEFHEVEMFSVDHHKIFIYIFCVVWQKTTAVYECFFGFVFFVADERKKCVGTSEPVERCGGVVTAHALAANVCGSTCNLQTEPKRLQ